MSSPRLPLQIGTSAIESLLRVGLMVPAIVALPFLTVMAIGALFCLRFDVAGDVFGFVVKTSTAFIEHVQRLFFERPSDLWCDDDGVHIEGGRFDGVTLSWALVGPSLRVEESDERTELYIDMFCIAQAEAPAERASLHQLHQSLASAVPGAALIAPAPSSAAQLVTCPTCGTPIVPSDAETTRCRGCDSDVPMPPALRQRVRGDRDLVEAGRRADALRVALRQQRRATRTAHLFVIAGVLMLLAWLVPVVIGVIAASRATLGGWSALDLALVAPLLMGGIYVVLRRLVADRFALRLITVGFAARAPDKVGEPSRCRACGAPLPAAVGRMLTACAYCRAENVLGIDLRGEAQRSRAELGSLDEALALRAAEVTRWAGLVPLGMAALVLAAVLAWLPLRIHREPVAPPPVVGVVVRPAAPTTVERCIRRPIRARRACRRRARLRSSSS